ncbi:MAG: hypothetical protein AB7Q17_17110 [Phycisphaerae bacterium]
MRIWVDKIASATRNVPLRRDIRVSDQIVAQEGYLIAGRIRGEKTVYNQIEDLYGRMVTLHDGDVIVGVLGHRNALHGYSGVVPESIRAGQTLHLLNLGGVIGQCTSENPDVGKPFDVEVLGAVLVFPEFESRAGVPAHIGMNAIRYDGNGLPDVPVVYVAGTCMNSGKTSAACRLIRELDARDIRIAACKLTGVSLRRDTLQMIDYGAEVAASFTDAGIVTTSGATAVQVSRGLISHLGKQNVEVVVAELGDGILGEYGVQQILADQALMSRSAALVLCANDPVGAWGAREVLRDQYGLSIDVVSGPTTDNAVGVKYVTDQLGLRAINARTHGRELGAFIADLLAARRTRSAS